MTLRRGIDGACVKSSCECEAIGLGDQCIWLAPIGSSRLLKVGDWALTDYNTRTDVAGRMQRVQIIAVDRDRKHGHSQSGVMYQVRPMLRLGTPDSWYDADWFVPAKRSDAP